MKLFGPTSEELVEIGVRVVSNPALRDYVGHAKARLLYVEVLDEVEPAKGGKPKPPSQFRATLYDDKRHRTVFADGMLSNPRKLALTESALPPPPSDAEFATAVKIVHRDAALGAALAAGHLEPYQPIPALLLTELPDGSVERRIAVGLLPRGEGAEHEIVAVDLAARVVTRFEGHAPDNARPQARGLCGVPRDANQGTASKGTAGQVWVTVTQGG